MATLHIDTAICNLHECKVAEWGLVEVLLDSIIKFSIFFALNFYYFTAFGSIVLEYVFCKCYFYSSKVTNLHALE